ncbi:MAG: DUF2007 domain-containing protein [Bacteroidota bacterium]
MELVTIKTFDNPIDAHLVKTKLESERIACVLFDENIVGLNPLYNITVGGIKLRVNKADVERAVKIVEQADNAVLINEQGEVINCPRCKSDRIYSGFKSMKGTKGVLSAIVSFLFLVFPIYYKTVYKCKSCGNEFK